VINIGLIASERYAEGI